MTRLIPGIFGRTTSYYYETSPNVRVHIPFDIAAAPQGLRGLRPHARRRQADAARSAPLSAKLCIARLEDGKVVAFGRRCPHLGGDLALGTLRDGKVLCPLHNLPVDPETGQSPCRSLRAVDTWPVEQNGDVWRVRTEAEVMAASA